MPTRTQSASTSHAEFMRAANNELTKFERREREFRKQDRDERAKRLQLPVENLRRRRLARKETIKRTSSNLRPRAPDDEMSMPQGARSERLLVHTCSHDHQAAIPCLCAFRISAVPGKMSRSHRIRA
ncbi:hypothetical protein FXB38_41425 [Bradyrhizobium cytisi]|uniref:Uncharacterized protein n=1 Tax=Bradyrhizobium cytisi TaxID=515489 RepID=A0A5S4VXF1_9BRAD|nr:hypothetical protein FXB38_41425 [Bradyrhizobium cytisi]